MPKKKVEYFDDSKDLGLPIIKPGFGKYIASRTMFPILTLLSREQSLKLKLTPIDDERVIMVLRYVKGKALDVGCGANYFIKSYKNGVGVDVVNWGGVDKVISDAAKLPFKAGEFGTVTFIACLNHVPNREDAVKDAYRVTKKNGKIIITMLTPAWGRFIHWWRFKNDPDHKIRHIDHEDELLGMSPAYIKEILQAAGYRNIKRKRFVFGLNNLFVADK